MPIITSPSTRDTGKIIAALEDLGGKAKQDFRFTHWRGQEALEVTDELYDQWQQEQGGGAAEAEATEDDSADGAEPMALTGGVKTAAEHSTHSHTTTVGRNSVHERNLHNYEATRDGNTVTPRTAHDQNDPPPPPPEEGTEGEQPVTAKSGEGEVKGVVTGEETTDDSGTESNDTTTTTKRASRRK